MKTVEELVQHMLDKQKEKYETDSIDMYDNLKKEYFKKPVKELTDHRELSFYFHDLACGYINKIFDMAQRYYAAPEGSVKQEACERLVNAYHRMKVLNKSAADYHSKAFMDPTPDFLNGLDGGGISWN